MNREIKFRGQRKDSKEWVYGSLLILTTGYYIVPENTYYNELIIDMGEKTTLNALWEYNDFFEVIPETVGQYTGLEDRNGFEIYKGDIVLAGHYKWKCIVEWDKKGARFICYTIESERKIVYVGMVDKNDNSVLEIIGNIYENKNLLEGAKYYE